MMNKTALRKFYLQQRRSLSSEVAKEKSEAIKRQFLQAFDLTHIACIHTFLPIIKHNEIDTWLIIEALEYKQWVIPQTDFQKKCMLSCSFEGRGTLEENKWGILEPINPKPVDNQQIDMVLVPLLVFDENGYRVGYGGGFYDRFLAECQEHCFKVGLSFFDPIVAIEDVDGYDIQMDFCITPDRVFAFGQ